MSRGTAITSDSVTVPSSSWQEVIAPLLKPVIRWRAPLGFGFAALLVYVGWIGRESRDISAGEGLGYALGIIGGTLMVALLLYSVRKRIPLLRNLGATRHWFRMHMALGIVGPVIILYHSNFQVGSINSQVALYCTLLVAASGIVGRYFYAQIHNGLYGSSSSLRQLVNTVEASKQQTQKGPGLNREVRSELAELAEAVLQRPESLGKSALAPIRLGIKTRLMYWKLSWASGRNINELAKTSPVIMHHRRRLKRTTKVYLRRRLAEIRRVAQFGFFDRLFSLWHIVHVPFFIMMVLSAIVHVLAVHMY